MSVSCTVQHASQALAEAPGTGGRGPRSQLRVRARGASRPGWTGPEPLISRVVSPTLDPASRAEPTACDQKGRAGTQGHDPALRAFRRLWTLGTLLMGSNQIPSV